MEDIIPPRHQVTVSCPGSARAAAVADPRPRLGGGGWCGPPGARAQDTGGNYTAGAGAGPDWWDS